MAASRGFGKRFAKGNGMTTTSTNAFSAAWAQITQRRFQNADANNDGTLSKDEFLKAMKEAPRKTVTDAEEEFNRLDKNGDGKISEDEMQFAAQDFFDKVKMQQSLFDGLYTQQQDKDR